MTPPLPALMPTPAVAEQARLRPASALPPLTHIGQPWPVRGGRSPTQFLFFFGRGEILRPAVGYELWPPSHLALFAPQTGRFEELRAVAPGDYGLRNPPDQPLAVWLSPGERKSPDYLNKLIRWQQALDAILPSFVANQFGLSKEQQGAASEVTKLMPQVLETPWWPYYQASGREFLEWLKFVTPK